MAPSTSVGRRPPLKTYSRRSKAGRVAKLPSTAKTSARPATGPERRRSALKPVEIETETKTETETRGDVDVPHSEDYLESDELVGWRFYPSTKAVDILTARPACGASREQQRKQRLVPEALIQRKTPSKLYAYWSSFGQPREVTLGTDYYTVFDIVDHDPSRGLKVQWVGYPPSDSATTWEPVSKVRKLHPDLVASYLSRHGLNGKLVGVRSSS